MSTTGKMTDPLRECFTTTESGGGEYRISMKFPTLTDMQAGHRQLIDLLAEQHQGEPVALAIPEECPHLIVFDDTEVASLMFSGAGARASALKKWEAISTSWNAHLFVRVARNSRDDGHPCAAAEDAGEVERLEAELANLRKLHDSSCDQLAERDALLRRIRESYKVQDPTDEDLACWKAIDAALSSSAEPSAPKCPKPFIYGFECKAPGSPGKFKMLERCGCGECPWQPMVDPLVAAEAIEVRAALELPEVTRVLDAGDMTVPITLSGPGPVTKVKIDERAFFVAELPELLGPEFRGMADIATDENGDFEYGPVARLYRCWQARAALERKPDQLFGLNVVVDPTLAPGEIRMCGCRSAAASRPADLQLNPPDQLPPVDCPLLIKLDDGSVVQAERTSHIQHRGLQMDYRLADGTTITGRFAWTFP